MSPTIQQIGELELLSLAMCEFVEQNHRRDYMSTNQCTLMFDTVGDLPMFCLRGVDAMKANFGTMPSFNFDGSKLIYKDNPNRVILVEFE